MNHYWIMKLRTGVDLIEIERIVQAITRSGERFLTRVYTQCELDEFGENMASLAARFAAKEAVSKALGCGIGEIRWQEIEVLGGPRAEPILILHGKAQSIAKELGLTTWSLSLSHTKGHAVAMVVAIGN
jgi:holo-[acyl-carrier protein] synthase